jgi:hypothetical protein
MDVRVLLLAIAYVHQASVAATGAIMTAQRFPVILVWNTAAHGELPAELMLVGDMEPNIVQVARQYVLMDPLFGVIGPLPKYMTIVLPLKPVLSATQAVMKMPAVPASAPPALAATDAIICHHQVSAIPSVPNTAAHGEQLAELM